MSLFLILSVFLVLIIILLFAVALKIIFVINTDFENVNLTLLWLQPFLKTCVSMEDGKPAIRIYLFNKMIYKSTINLRKNKSSGLNMVKLVNPQEIHVDAYYGFQDPFITGIACGAINVASKFIKVDMLQQVPDFMANKDYIYVKATAKINLGQVLIGLYKNRRN